MNKRIILCGILFLITLIMPVSAITIDSIDISWDNPRIFTVNGKVDSGNSGEKVTIEVVNPIKNAADYVLGKQDQIFFNYFAQTTSGENGGFSYQYNIESSTTKNGSFTIRLRSSNEQGPPKEISFPYYTPVNCNNRAAELNAFIGKTQKDDAAIEAIATHFDTWLNKVYFVEFPLYNELNADGYKSEIAESVSYFLSFPTGRDAAYGIKASAAITAINHCEPSGYDKYFSTYSKELGIRELTEYAAYCNYNADKKADFAVVFKRSNTQNTLKQADYSKLFAESVVLYELSSANGNDAVKRVLNQYAGYFDFSIYNKLGNSTDKVCGAIAAAFENNQIYSIEDVQRILDTLIPKETKTHSGGGGGGGSGSAKTSGTVVAPTVTAAPTVQKVKTELPDAFIDLEDAEWAKEAIQGLASSGIVSGSSANTFAPNDYLTRAQFAKMICKLFYIEGEITETGFTDVSSADWYAPYISALKKLGIVNGVSDTRFGSEENISRQDLIVILDRAASLNRVKIGAGDKTAEFSDEKVIKDYARDSVKLFAGAGIVNGMPDGSFAPDGLSTRAEAAKIVFEIKKLYEGRTSE